MIKRNKYKLLNTTALSAVVDPEILVRGLEVGAHSQRGGGGGGGDQCLS